MSAKTTQTTVAGAGIVDSAVEILKKIQGQQTDSLWISVINGSKSIDSEYERMIGKLDIFDDNSAIESKKHEPLQFILGECEKFVTDEETIMQALELLSESLPVIIEGNYTEADIELHGQIEILVKNITFTDVQSEVDGSVKKVISSGDLPMHSDQESIVHIVCYLCKFVMIKNPEVSLE